MIVIVIIAIAAVMAVPLMSSAGSLQVRSAANMIASDLEYAKSMAISRGRSYSVVFDKDAESYQIEDENGVIAHPVRKGFNYVVNFASRGLDKVDIVNASFNSTSVVKFNFLGSPLDENNGPLNNKGVVSLAAGSVLVTVEVEPVTGFITIKY